MNTINSIGAISIILATDILSHLISVLFIFATSREIGHVQR